MAALKKHIAIGAGGGLGLVAVYLAVLVPLQGAGYAFRQAAGMWYWVLALVLGFGVQVGLFSFIRQAMRERRAAATSSLATSGTVSAGSMVACCAHHLSDVLPLLGISGATLFVVRYQTFFIATGVVSNIVGIIVMLATVQRHGLSPRLARIRWDLRSVTKWAMGVGIVLIAVAFFVLGG